MGNYCSSTKKDKDNISDKSEESPSYQLAAKKKFNDGKEAPLADPEPTSDISNQNVSAGCSTNITTNSSAVTTTTGANGRPILLNEFMKQPANRALQNVQGNDSASSSPLAQNAPIDLSNFTILPPSLQSLNGNPTKNRRTEKDRKIVLYILAPDDGHRPEKDVLHSVFTELRNNYASRGFELQLADVHDNGSDLNFLDGSQWANSGPLEARGGHQLAAICLAEISRHSNLAYVIPVLFLGTSLGSPLLPLTIENQDFCTALLSTECADDKELLEKWYILDDKALPQCYRLRTSDFTASDEITTELMSLLTVLVAIFSKELRDSYLTTVVEQEINNTVLINHELSRRCIWIQTGALPSKILENGTAVDNEMNRRLNNLHSELKNQLMDKNLIRIPPTIQFQADQLAALFDTLIASNIESILDEHVAKYQIPHCTFGVDKNLLHELEAVNQHSKILEQNCANFGIMDKIKCYLVNPSTEPLLVFGKTGCGKSVLSAKVAQNIHSWLPSCSFIIRYTNLTPLTTDIVSIVGSIAEQVCYLTQTKSCIGPHDIEFYAATINDCIATTNQQICILIDSIDEAQNLTNLDWMPATLKENVKIILTVTAESLADTDNVIMNILLERLQPTNIIHLDQFSDDQWKDVLSLGGGDFYTANGALHLPESLFECSEKIPLQAKIFWWLTWLDEFDFEDTTLSNICDKVFETLEKKFKPTVVRFLISLLITSRDGLRETELIELMKESKLVEGSSSAQIWIEFCWVMGPMLMHTNHVRLTDRHLRKIAAKRYENDVIKAHKILYDFYQKQPDRYQDKRGKFECYNTAKFIELPHHAFKVDELRYPTTLYLTDITWLYSKLSATGCVHILNDLYVVGERSPRKLSVVSESDQAVDHISLLRKFLEQNIRPLNYDARQLYSLLPAFVEYECSRSADLAADTVIVRWRQHFQAIPIPYLETLGNAAQEMMDAQRRKSSAVDVEAVLGAAATTSSANRKAIGYDVIANLGGEGYFVASLSVEREEICVWDVSRCMKVRTLLGCPLPTAMCPVGDHGAAVLCRREIKVIDLNEGAFKVTLKGVMNQKMPFFGLHDAQHLVCLSRNRMYVNLMNLESGDCITTFKAGEDRFLNSLLVSGDGRILVCGDETQKPFPLLVWHLSQRKLLYDLRIPHHDFQTTLSAITHEGAYVSVVAKELNEPTPNFIVVYDLQSGTLFKKWKPSCNTVALAISQTNTCVIAGLEDARILIWDLVTGNCKYTLFGHTAPVTLLKLDPTGKVLLSADKEGRDLSVRLWELDTGKPLAVHTPTQKVTTCEILPQGKFIVLALDRHPNLVTLRLHNASVADSSSSAAVIAEEAFVYGSKENEAKVFQL